MAERRRRLWLGVEEGAAGQEFDVGVVGHEGHVVAGAEEFDGPAGGHLGQLELAAAHGARLVDDQGHVERQPLAVAGGLGRGDAHADVAGAVNAGADQPAGRC